MGVGNTVSDAGGASMQDARPIVCMCGGEHDLLPCLEELLALSPDLFKCAPLESRMLG